MGLLVHSQKQQAGDTTIVQAVTQGGLDVGDIPKHIPDIYMPNRVSVRSLQAAANPDGYNLREYPTLRAHSEELQYERTEVTMAEARDDEELRGRITSDDEFDFDADDVVFVRHTWYIPSDITSLD